MASREQYDAVIADLKDRAHRIRVDAQRLAPSVKARRRSQAERLDRAARTLLTVAETMSPEDTA